MADKTISTKTSTAKTAAAKVLNAKGPGRENKFKGVKLTFLDACGEDEYLDWDPRHHGKFYGKVAKAFLDKFGYTLPHEAEISDDVDIDSLKAPDLDVDSMGQAAYDLEAARRDDMYSKFKKVSATICLAD